MSFDQYFENTEKQTLQHADNDDWYAIVEEALHAADVAPNQHRQKLEANLMKPLPMIPEDAMDEPLIVESLYDLTRRPSSVYSVEEDVASSNELYRSINAPSCGRRLELQIPATHIATRRASSVHSLDFDSPLSSESSALDSWATNICGFKESTSGSLRSKPFNRPSSSTRSAVSTWSASSIGSSVLASRRRSTSSSIYSTDTSIDSYGSFAKSMCIHSRSGSSKSSASSTKKVRFDEEALTSFFDFSDDEEEEQEEVTVARPESSASSYVKNLRKKALSLRIATSKIAHGPVKMTSLPSNEMPGQALSDWLSRSSSLDRVSSPATSDCSGLEGQLMTGAAHSAKARRVLGLK